jgi:nitroimidazol reductase NimA-like FMN-containing flavoprotein (pyridoxamine 5'-phosphate oxidase superfamily)
MTDTPEPLLDHAGAEVLTPDECYRLLASAPVGRVAFVDAGDVVVLPVNLALWHHSIVFRTLPGSKLDAAVMSRRVAVEVDGWNAVTHEGWSVLARGSVTTVEEADVVEELEALGLEQWIHTDVPRTWVRVLPDEVTGRRVRSREEA